MCRHGAKRHWCCACPDDPDRARRNGRRDNWHRDDRNDDAGDAFGHNGALSVGLRAVLFVVAADNTDHARISIDTTDLSDESRYAGDHAIGCADHHKSGMLADLASRYGNCQRNSDRRRLPLTIRFT